MPRPQFSIRSMLWMAICVACFFVGMAAIERLKKMGLQQNLWVIFVSVMGQRLGAAGPRLFLAFTQTGGSLPPPGPR